MKKLKRITIQIDVRDCEDMTKVFWKTIGQMAKNGTETAEFSIDSANVVFHMGYIEKSMNWAEKTIDGQTCRIYQSRMDD